MKYLFETEGDCPKDNSNKTLDQAEKAYVQALELSEGLKSTLSGREYAEMRARLLLNLGLVCEQRGNLSGCAENIRHAIFLASKYDLHEDLNRCQYSLATVYQKHKQYSCALRLLDGAIVSAGKLHDIPLKCEALVTKASILISLKDFEGGKLCLKTAYKLHSPIPEDHKKITSDLKITVGLCISQKKLLNLNRSDHHERKILLEKIADALASLNCYKLAIEYYSSVLKCMEEIGSPKNEKAPIYFSLAQTYYDDGDPSKALEFLQIELNCNENKPSEQIKTLWKMADILEEKQNFEECEKKLIKAVSLAEEIESDKFMYRTLEKLLTYYQNNKLNAKAESIKAQLEILQLRTFSNSDESDVEDECEDPFADIHLSEISDIQSETEEDMDLAARSKRRPKKAVTKVNEKGETPLHQACINGNFNMVKRLVESGHPVNTRDFCGWTPLHEACNYGYYDIVEYLLEKGAHINDRGG
ncbi:Tonsoku-like protein, partial [Stegodyphus mimosarum]